MVKPSSILLLLALALALTALGCGGGSSPAAKADVSAVPSGEGACALLMQAEVDELFESPASTGANETLQDGIELCSWPPGDDPWLLVQVGPAAADIRNAVALGDGYEIQDVAGMPGPAAMAVESTEGVVVVIAVKVGDKTLTVSPFGLGIPSSGPRFETLESTLTRVAGRM